MKKILTVLQHTSADYLGHMEDHFEGRNIGFRYYRPFTESGKVPPFSEVGDGLVLLGGGPWGCAGGRDVPTLKEEVKFTRACFMSGLPIIASRPWRADIVPCGRWQRRAFAARVHLRQC